MRRILRTLALAIILVCFATAEPANLYAAAKTTSAAKSSVSSKKTAQSKKNAQKSGKKSGKGSKTRKSAPAVATGDNFKGAILMDIGSGQTVFSRRADQKVAPASLTKILSMFVVFDHVREKKISLNTLVPISRKAAAAGGSRMGLQYGDKVTLDELLMGMAIASGNDASIAVAEFVGKTEDGFVRLMNRKAQALGMNSSTFKNASGLPAKGQLTTARDMLTLARKYLATHPTHLNKYHSFRTLTYNGQTTSNANPLLGKYPGADGLKTGYVGAAGFNLISTAKRGNTRLLGVLLGAPTRSVRADETVTLLEGGFATVASKSQGIPSASLAAAKKQKSVGTVATAQPKSTKTKTQQAAKGKQDNSKVQNTKASKQQATAPAAKTPRKIAAKPASTKNTVSNAKPKASQGKSAAKAPAKAVIAKPAQPHAKQGKNKANGA